MLCSVPASKSGSNWLDRLRSNKGFPAGDNLDLDHFLSRNPNTSSSEFPSANASSASTESSRPDSDRVANRSGSAYQNQDKQGEAFMGRLMDSVLSELFFMGGADESSKLSGKKIPRKQTNPRICVASVTNSNSNSTATASTIEEKSSDCVGKNRNALVETPSLNSDNKREFGNAGCGEGEEVEEEEGEEKGEMKELEGYSRSEVTVIDTSCRVWKTEKVVFRRKSVWKVREKKVKVRSFGRRKRKVVDEEVGVEAGEDIDKKKPKVSALEESDGVNECIALKSTQGQNSQNDPRKEVRENEGEGGGTPDNLKDKGEEFGKDMTDNKSKDTKKGLVHLQVLSDFNKSKDMKGFPLNRSPRKLKKGDSSVILIKGIPTDNKNGGKLPRKCLKDNQKQY